MKGDEVWIWLDRADTGLTALERKTKQAAIGGRSKPPKATLLACDQLPGHGKTWRGMDRDKDVRQVVLGENEAEQAELLKSHA